MASTIVRTTPLTDSAAAVELRHVGKSFLLSGRPLEVLRDVSLTAQPGEFLSIVGASGCGKSTLLRLIVGLERADRGDVLVDGAPVAGPDRDRGIVFQDHRLFPWLTVEQNIMLALRSSDFSTKERVERVRHYIDLVGLAGFAQALPGQLSGGMAQRAAIARALVTNPRVLLLDEPLGALDALTRIYLQDELLRIWETEKPTVILVTHDIDEALFLGDRVAVMGSRPGEVKEIIFVDADRPRDRADPTLSKLKAVLFSLLGERRVAV
jgi:ABC-type nitrate/sulfonate/bicarbonate transport system ATPase subunit